MQTARQLSLFIAITIWGILIGGIAYAHIVYFPPYLAHLPGSNRLISGVDGLHDENFWMSVHPIAILFTIITLVLNWKLKARRTFILMTFGIYALTIAATATYFVPELKAFAASSQSTTVTPAELIQRGQTWLRLSWVRGIFMYLGFILLVVALTKGKHESSSNL